MLCILKDHIKICYMTQMMYNQNHYSTTSV